MDIILPDNTQSHATDTFNVFVYGTLQPGERFHEDICSPHPFTARKAWVQGRLFDFPKLGYPAATESPHSKIMGQLLCFEPPALGLLEALDQLEGYNPHGAPENNLYYRRIVSVWLTHDNASLPAWCYFMTPDRIKAQGGVELTNGRWP